MRAAKKKTNALDLYGSKELKKTHHIEIVVFGGWGRGKKCDDSGAIFLLYIAGSVASFVAGSSQIRRFTGQAR